MAYESKKIDITSVVISTSSTVSTPLLGKYATDISWAPWKWDERAWTSEQDENSYQYVPCLCDQSSSSIELSGWQSGVGHLATDLELLRIEHIREDNRDRWVPIVRHGRYFCYGSPRYLFADGFDTVYFTNDTQTEIQLPTIPKNGTPISVILWQRDIRGNPVPAFICQKVVELPSETWKNCFIVDWGNPENYDEAPKLVFPRNMVKQVGIEIEDVSDIRMLEYLGNMAGRTRVELKYFPILAGTLKLYNTVGDEITSFNVDIDKGEIELTTSVMGSLYASYLATPTIQYESISCGDEVSLQNVNLDPFSAFTSQGFIYLTEEDLRAYSISLESGANSVNLGGDYCYLTATVTSYSGQPIHGVEVTFSFASEGENQGFLNGATGTFSMVTNARGQATVVYTTPRSLEAISQYTDNVVNFSASSELLVEETNGLNEDMLNNVFVYRVIDNDEYAPWNGERGGRKVLLMEERDNYLFYPVHPISFSIEGTTGHLGFNRILEEITDLPTDNLVAYWVTGGKRVEIKVSCFSLIFDRTIESDTIAIGLSIPDHMKGTYIDGNEEIPLGFRLFDGTLNGVASALDGATYLYPKNWIRHTFEVI